jgi:type 1 fimbriae regulatory protein FimE
MKRRDRSRPRNYLTEEEVERVITAAGRLGRNGHRDSTLVRVCFRHGFRVSELVSLTWGQIDLDKHIMHISRLKGGTPAVHDMTGQEVRALRRLLEIARRDRRRSDYVFLSEREDKPLCRRGVQDIISRAGQSAGIGIPVHPHTLRHTCGHVMATRGIHTRAIQAWLGHTNISVTVEYTQLAEGSLAGLW